MAVIGCGDASFAMGLAARLVPGVRVGLCVDPDTERAKRFAKRNGGTGTADSWKAVCDSADADFAYVAVPHHLHEEIGCGLVSAGVPVLMEKPLAQNVASAERLAAAGRASGNHVPTLGVNYQYRYDAKAWALVEAARTGRLGSLHHIVVDVPWYRTERYFHVAAWHGVKAQAGGGTLLTQGSHALDIALICTGSRPVAASGRIYQRVFTGTEVEDLALGVVDTRAGIPVSITSSMVSRPGYRLSISVYGSRGSAVYRGPSRAILRSRGVRIPNPPVLTRLASYRGSVRGFARWVAGGEEYRCRCEDALTVLRAVDGVYRSSMNNGALERIEE